MLRFTRRRTDKHPLTRANQSHGFPGRSLALDEIVCPITEFFLHKIRSLPGGQPFPSFDFIMRFIPIVNS
jgi:hypothetical protein